jgi:hypothetical protein
VTRILVEGLDATLWQRRFDARETAEGAQLWTRAESDARARDDGAAGALAKESAANGVPPQRQARATE